MNMIDHTSKPQRRPLRPPVFDIIRGLFGAFIGIGSIAALVQFILNDADLILVIGSFASTAALIYGAPYSPLAQPFNVVFGHLVSAVVGVTIFQIVGEANWFSAALAVSLAIFAMQVSRSLHPPGGATAMIAVLGSPEIHELGFLFIIYPVGLGVALLVSVALVTNNFRTHRSWPEFWL